MTKYRCTKCHEVGYAKSQRVIDDLHKVVAKDCSGAMLPDKRRTPAQQEDGNAE